MRVKASLILFFLLNFVLLPSCSNKRKEKAKASPQSMKVSDEENIDLLVEDLNDSPLEDQGTQVVEDIELETGQKMSPASRLVKPERKPLSISGGAFSTYTVQERNETLMLIAFHLYGDYRKWKDLAAWNRESLRNSYSVSVGQQIRYKVPNQSFSWNPGGTPYLIQRGDSLSKISNTVYGTYSKWKTLWHHNKPMIRDPNLIFVGFTLYYP